jgi:translation initiation factor 5B
LFDAFTAYNAEITEAKRRDAAPMAVWPCRLKIIACFCKRDPIILGVDILDGNLRVGTPLCVVKLDPATNAKEIIELGKMYGFHSSYSSFGVTNTTSQYFSGN